MAHDRSVLVLHPLEDRLDLAQLCPRHQPGGHFARQL
jgi:hypothetical protein